MAVAIRAPAAAVVGVEGAEIELVCGAAAGGFARGAS